MYCCSHQPELKNSDFFSLKTWTRFLRSLQINSSKKNCIKKYGFLFIFFLLFSLILFAQQKINGIVLNDNNLPLGGAAVSISGSAITAVTLNDGTFFIHARQDDILEISFIGFQTQKIKIAKETRLKIILLPSFLA